MSGVAALIGKSQTTVAQTIGILKLPAAILGELESLPGIAPAVLTEIVFSKNEPELQLELWELAKAGVTLREIRDARRVARAPEGGARKDHGCGDYQSTDKTVSESPPAPQMWRRTVVGLGRDLNSVSRRFEVLQDLWSKGMRCDGKTTEQLMEMQAVLESLHGRIGRVLGVPQESGEGEV